jgi:serine/threonine protein kinase/Tfp pilus assembly protein PilF
LISLLRRAMMKRRRPIMELYELLPGLPLPLAQLGRRVLNSKAAADRHAAAYYLAEATLKLAVAARVGLFVAHGDAPAALRLERLLDEKANMARWCVVLDEVGQALTQRTDAALLPLAEATLQLTQPRSDWTAVAALTDYVERQGVIEATLARRSRGRGLIGALTVIAARGPSLSSSQTKNTDGELLVAAVLELITSPALFGGLELARVAALGPPVRWQSLTGFEPQPFPIEGPSEADLGAGRLYLVGPGARIPLHPLVAAREDAIGRLQVGFLNPTVRRTRKGEHGSVEELRRIDFLDYASGELFADADADEALRRLLAPQKGEGHNTQSATVGVNYPTPDRTDEDEVLEANAVVGDFQLLSELGKGGMGVVYKAMQLSVRRKVALKVLPASLAEDPVMISRFRREVAALQRCDHPNVVKVLTSGIDAGRHYYAMEFVDGANLAQTLRVLSRWCTPATGQLKEGHLQAAVTSTGRPGRIANDPAMAATAAEGAASEPEAPLPPMSEGRPIESRLAELFADAASGLAHLHEAGVIHRDIKPANLMLTADAQRIVIMDLGVARLDDESRALTSTDVKILGTLRYMPPEQLDRQKAPGALDHRADIYSLGVTLYEMATGHYFFEGESDEEIIRKILNDEPRPALEVAPHLNRDLDTVLQVATAKLPAKRYQTARALEAELRALAAGRAILAKPPSAIEKLGQWVRRHRPHVAAAAAVLLIGVLNLVWRQHQSQLCRGAEERLQGAWDRQIKEAVKKAFLATDRPYAGAAFQSVEAALDARAAAWAAMHREACEATRLRGEQSEQLLDRRMSCLAERREELRTLGEVFSHADVPVVERAVAAAEGLSPLSVCADRQLLVAQMALPKDDKAAAQVAALREEIARVKALEQAGRHVEGLKRIRDVVTSAQALDYRPLVAEALYMRGRLEDASSSYDAAERSYYEAWWAAEAAGHDQIKARAASQLVYLVGYMRAHHQEALQIDHNAQAIDERLGNRPDLESARHNSLGAVQRAMGDYDHALGEFQEALALHEKQGLPEGVEIADTLNNLGNVLDDKGDQDKALAMLQRALAIRQKVLGPDHPDVAHTLNNLGVVYHNKGDDTHAFEYYQRALAIEEKSLGPEDPSVAGSLTNLGGLLADRGERDKALEYHRRALVIWEKTLGPDHPNTGITVNNIGEELRHRQRWDEALAQYARAEAIFTKAVGPDHPAVAMVLSNVGQARLGKREFRPAQVALERVFAICDKKTCEPSVLSESAFALAEVYWQLGQREKARAFANRARAIYEKAPGAKDKVEEIATWLSHHGS